MKELFAELSSEYSNSAGRVAPAFYEEFCEGTELNYRYLAKKFNKTISKAEAQRLIAQYFGSLSLKPSRDYENEVDFKEFMNHYEFGKYPNTRGWIQHIYDRTGLILTREKLYEHIRAT